MSAATVAASGPPTTDKAQTAADPKRILVGAVTMIAVGWFIGNGFLALAYYPQWFAVGMPVFDKIIQALLAMVLGIGGAVLFFYCMNVFVEGLPGRLGQFLMPYAWILPGYFTIGLLLLYPAIQTVNYSLANEDSTAYVTPIYKNFQDVFADEGFTRTIGNNLLWLLIVPATTVVIGLLVAVLADRLSPKGESISKAMMFMPMAISFVGASTIWGFIYDYQSGDTQIGLLNAIVTAVGGEAQSWLTIDRFALNSMLLMVIVVWLQVGYAMVLLSTAIKNVPEDTLEAARIDGASELKIFFLVVIPQMKGTIITVFVTVFIMVMKIFDIVYVMTGGNYKTKVVAVDFFNQMFTNFNNGTGAAIVVLLLIAITPILVFQVRQARKEGVGR